MQITRISLMMLAVGSFMLSADMTMAQQPSEAEGVVQLGHRAQARRAARQTGSNGGCLSDACCDPCVAGCDRCDGGCGCTNGGACGCGRNCGCGNGSRCGNGCRSGFGAGRCGRCWGGGLCGRNCGYGCNPYCGRCGLSCLLNKLSPYHVCTYSPDHGWAAPLERPMGASPASYRRMFPAKWTGEAVDVDPSFRHPTVYMPTDTTQLGYYYQHTPFWRSRDNMIPPVPQPEQWHTPDVGVSFSGWEGVQGCPAGALLEGGSSEPSTPTEEATPVPMMESNPAQPEPAPAPPTETSVGKTAAVPQLVPVPR